jgi:capsular exopolysaccharide synthesis family protein
MVPFRKAKPEELEPAAPDEGRAIPVKAEELVIVSDPFGAQAEQVRRLRNTVQALNPDGAARTILLTSAVRGEGKTVATLNLAGALAELPRLRVLVVDADVRNPGVEQYLGLPRRQGLSELLMGKLPLEQAVRPTSIERFDVVGAGSLPRNPAEILNLDRIRAVLSELKRRYDYVLIDTPPALAVNDAGMFGSVADGILLVVRLGSTAREQVQEAYNLLENLGGNVLGTFLTGGAAGADPYP